METWMWVSLWILQTFIGAVMWRKYGNTADSTINILGWSSLVFLNVIGLAWLIVLGSNFLFEKLCLFIDFLAGKHKKNKMKKYQHYRNGNFYVIEEECKIQEDGVWKEAIIYSELDGEELYVRESAEFFNKFKYFNKK